MTTLVHQPTDILAVARAHAQSNSFSPRGTVRCRGPAMFRTQAARDVACLLDVDDEVDAWSCLPASLGRGDKAYVPDFLVRRGDRHTLIDVGQGPERPWLATEAEAHGCDYETWPIPRVQDGFRLANARDLLRYANWRCPLGDRIRLLAGLEEAGSLTVVECMAAFREATAIAGLASLVLNRFISVDLDAGLIGPGTTIRLHPR